MCAFDNDEPGDKAAQALRRHRFERLRPGGKDWNDDLQARRAAGGRGRQPRGSGGASERSEKPPEPWTKGAAGARLLTFLPFLPFLFRGDSGGERRSREERQPPFGCVNKPGNRLFGKIGAERARPRSQGFPLVGA